PAGNTGIARVLKLPLTPKLFAGGGRDGAWSVIAVLAHVVFMSVVMLTGVKLKVRTIISHVGFEGPILRCFETRRSGHFPERRDLIVHEVLTVARGVSVKFVF